MKWSTVSINLKQFLARWKRENMLLVELRKSEEQFRTLAESNQDYIMRYDRQCRHTYMNSAGLKVSGMTMSDVFGKTHLESGYPEELSHFWEGKIKEVFDTEEPRKVEFKWESSEGVVFLDWQLTPELDENGKVNSVLGVSRDITEQKQTELALQRAKEDLEQKAEEQTSELDLSKKLLEERVVERTADLELALSELESFSHSVSHDLRAPLRHINSYLAILSEDFGDLLPLEAHGFLDRSRAASRRMVKLIDDILELSKVSRTDLIKETIDLSKIATHACDWLFETEPHRTVEVVISEGLSAQGDNSLLVQMMGNLLGNAWKYTSKNPSARIEFGKEFVANQEIFYVRDNGVGFDMAYSDNLFREFQRLHGPEYEGTGIGLATVKRIVDRHGGRVWADAKLNEGATFYFTLC